MNGLTRYFEAVDGRQSYWARQNKLFGKQRDEADKRAKLEDRADADIAAISAVAIAATEMEIKAFAKKLDKYETASVEALMENDRQMDIVQLRLTELLDRAHVLEDGRRVFKTEDGTQVFDEHGAEVGVDTIAPSDIDDSRPTWEAYQPILEEKQALEAEREGIIAYQDKLDESREKLEEGGLTQDELDEMDTELAELMPPAVKTLAGIEAGPEPVAQNAVTTPSLPIMPIRGLIAPSEL